MASFKKDKDKDGLVINGQNIPPQPQITAAGNYFRTAGYAYSHADGGSQHVTALRQDDTANIWTIQHIFVERNADGRMAHAVVSQKDELTYYQALYYCAGFEAAKKAEGWFTAGKDAASLGLAHYVAFSCAEMEGRKDGVVYDEEGLPHPAINGHPLDSATYEEDALDRAAAHAQRPAGTLRKSWAEQVVETMLPGLAQPAAFDSFAQDAKILALIEKLAESGARIEAALKAFDSYFDEPVPSYKVEDYISRTKVNSISCAFATAAKDAERNTERLYNDSMWDMNARSKYQDYDHRSYTRRMPKESFLTFEERRKALHGAAAPGAPHALTVARLLERLSTDSRSIKDSIEQESKDMDGTLTELRTMGCDAEDFIRFRALLDFSYKFFKAKAGVAYVRAYTGKERLGALEELKPMIAEAKDAFGKLGGAGNDPKIIEGMVLSPGKPDIPVFIHMFLDQFDALKQKLKNKILTPAALAPHQMHIPLQGGECGFLPMTEDKDVMQLIRTALEEAGSQKIDKTLAAGYKDGIRKYRRY